MTIRNSENTTAPRARLAAAGLSPMETRCLAMSHFDGCTQHQIAAEFCISRSTVQTHLRRGRRKLAAAKLAFRNLARADSPVCFLMDRPELADAGAGACVGAW